MNDVFVSNQRDETEEKGWDAYGKRVEKKVSGSEVRNCFLFGDAE